jgi:hypothetical protein
MVRDMSPALSFSYLGIAILTNHKILQNREMGKT